MGLCQLVLLFSKAKTLGSGVDNSLQNVLGR